MAWGAIASVASGAGQSLSSQLGTAYSAIASKKQYKYLIELSHRQQALNKLIAAKNVSLTQDQAARNAGQLSRETGRVEGSQKAVSAAMGIGGGSVTTANLLEDTRYQASLDQMAIRYGADLKAWQINEDLALENWQEEVKIAQYESAKKEVIKSAMVSGFMALATGGSGGSQIASGVGSLLDRAGYKQPTQYGTVAGRSINSSNVAPADYYKTQGRVPTYLAVNR